MYYIYAHKHPEEKDYVYIGCGQEVRAFTKQRRVNHLVWLEDMLLQYTMKDIVVYLEAYEDKKEAHARETELLKEHKPKFNIIGVVPIQLGNSNKKGAKLSQESKDRISISAKGRVPWNKGLIKIKHKGKNSERISKTNSSKQVRKILT